MFMKKYFVLSVKSSNGDVVFEVGERGLDTLVEENHEKKRSFWRKIKSGKKTYQSQETLKFALGCNVADIIKAFYLKDKIEDLVGSILYIRKNTNDDFDLYVQAHDGTLENVFNLAIQEATGNRPIPSDSTVEGAQFKVQPSKNAKSTGQTSTDSHSSWDSAEFFLNHQLYKIYNYTLLFHI